LAEKNVSIVNLTDSRFLSLSSWHSLVQTPTVPSQTPLFPHTNKKETKFCITDEYPKIWSGGMLMQAKCLPDFVMFQNFMHQIACITMQ